MTKTKAEIEALVAQARKDRENAPKMDAESAARLVEKWTQDSRSFTPDMIRSPSEDDKQE